jgi:hypothetical protein
MYKPSPQLLPNIQNVSQVQGLKITLLFGKIRKHIKRKNCKILFPNLNCWKFLPWTSRYDATLFTLPIVNDSVATLTGQFPLFAVFLVSCTACVHCTVPYRERHPLPLPCQRGNIALTLTVANGKRVATYQPVCT